MDREKVKKEIISLLRRSDAKAWMIKAETHGEISSIDELADAIMKLSEVSNG